MREKSKKQDTPKASAKRYMMHTAPDGITWVTIQPLLIQTIQHLDEAKKIDVSELNDNERRGVDFTILSMESVVNFLRSLLTEHELETEIANERAKLKKDTVHELPEDNPSDIDKDYEDDNE